MENENTNQQPELSEAGLEQAMREADYDLESSKYARELDAIAADMQALLVSRIGKSKASLDLDAILARLLELKDNDMFDIRSNSLEHTVAQFVGRKLLRTVPDYIQMYDSLVSMGMTGPITVFDLGRDSNIYALPERIVVTEESAVMQELFGNATSSTRIRALVLKTQSLQFIVVLQKKVMGWAIHIRRLWPSLLDQNTNGYLLSLNEVKNAQNLTVVDLVRYASLAASYADDDLGGVHIVKRPSLAKVLEGDLLLGSNGGPALRYGDGRDAGYVVSVTDMDEPEAKDILWPGAYSDTGFVYSRLAAAVGDVKDAVEELRQDSN